MAETKKVEIGFGIGQALSVKLTDDELVGPAQGGRERTAAGTT